MIIPDVLSIPVPEHFVKHSTPPMRHAGARVAPYEHRPQRVVIRIVVVHAYRCRREWRGGGTGPSETYARNGVDPVATDIRCRFRTTGLHW